MSGVFRLEPGHSLELYNKIDILVEKVNRIESMLEHTQDNLQKEVGKKDTENSPQEYFDNILANLFDRLDGMEMEIQNLSNRLKRSNV